MSPQAFKLAEAERRIERLEAINRDLLEALKRLDAFIPDREGLQPVDAEVRAFMEHEGLWRAKELARDAIERAKSPG